MITSLLAVFGLYRCTIGRTAGPISVFQTVYLQSILTIVALFYYCLSKVCLVVFCPVQRRVPVLSESPQRRGTPLELSLSVPRLTIRNVWILVYGLGFVFFITGYCFLGLHPICLAFTGLAIGVLCVDELVCPGMALHWLYTAARSGTLVLALISLVLVSADLLDSMVIQYVSTLDIYSIIFGLVLPFGSQSILIVIRDNRQYSLETVIEVCEFGFPFAAFLGIFHLCVAYGQQFQSGTDALVAYNALLFSGSNISSTDLDQWYHFNDKLINSAIATNGPFLLFFALTPLLMVPALVCYMSCVLDGCAIDPLISLTFSLCVEHLITRPLSGPTSSLGIAGMVLIALAMCVRLLSEYRPDLTRPRYSCQSESSQLPHSVVWSREGRGREFEVEELTRDLQVDIVH